MESDLQLLLQIIEKEKKYSLDAYLFVREGLAYAADHLELDCCAKSVCEGHVDYKIAESICSETEGGESQFGVGDSQNSERETLRRDSIRKHVSGQQLCDGIRQYALAQFGYMSKTVLNSWGIFTTSDIGAIVYKMINAGIMKKSSKDRRSHFDNVFEFDEAFEASFDFAPSCCQARNAT